MNKQYLFGILNKIYLTFNAIFIFGAVFFLISTPINHWNKSQVAKGKNCLIENSFSPIVVDENGSKMQFPENNQQNKMIAAKCGVTSVTVYNGEISVWETSSTVLRKIINNDSLTLAMSFAAFAVALFVLKKYLIWLFRSAATS